MLSKYVPRNLSLVRIAIGALAGALLGAIVSVTLMSMRSSGEQERATPSISNYVRLGIATIMFVRQASELIAPPPKQA